MESPPLGSPESHRYQRGNSETPTGPRRLSMIILCKATPESFCSAASFHERNEPYPDKVEESIQISPLCSPAYMDRSIVPVEERANCAFLLTPEGNAGIEKINTSVLATPPRVSRGHPNSRGRTNSSPMMGIGTINDSDWSPSGINSYRGSPSLNQRYSRLAIEPRPGTPLTKTRVPLRDLKQFEAPLRKSFSNPSLSRIHQDSLFASTPVSNQPIKRHIFNSTKMLSPVPGISSSSTSVSSPLKSCLSRTPPSKRQKSVRFPSEVGLPLKIPDHCKPKMAESFGLSSFAEVKQKIFPVVVQPSDRNTSKSSFTSHRDNIFGAYK